MAFGRTIFPMRGRSKTAPVRRQKRKEEKYVTSASDNDSHDTVLTQAGLGPDDAFPLFETALAASALDHVETDIAAYRAHGAELAAKAQSQGASTVEDPESIVRRLADTIAYDFGYEGDTETYDAPENADLIRVIDRRKGLPVALGVLYLHTARAIGWPVFGVNLPGHFVLAAGDSDAPVIFDPFHKGQALSADDVASLMMQAQQDADDEGTYRLSGMTDREVLMRLMNNQRMRAAQSGDAQRTAEILRRMVLIVPKSAALWSDFAEASQAAGNMRSAIGAFEQVANLAPASDLSANAKAALTSLRKQLN